MISKICLPLLLVLTLSCGLEKPYETFDWRPMKAPTPAPTPYHNEPVTASYDSRYFETGPATYHDSTGYLFDSSLPFPEEPGSYQRDPPYNPDSFSSDFPKSEHYKYPDDSGSFENYGYSDEEFNITKERYGGFGGTGDTRGYGAYDFPKKVEEVPQDIHEDFSPMNADFPDLLRIGSRSRSRSSFHKRDPMPVHPLPPPL